MDSLLDFSLTYLLRLVFYLLVASLIFGSLVLYCYLKLTTVIEPDLYFSQSETGFLDPETNDRTPFPRTALSPPTLYMSLVVPAYKEESRLPVMMKETMEYLEKRQQQEPSFRYEVIIVNDGSPDNTAQEALKFVRKYGTDKVRLLDLTKNRGKGGAVRMGSLSARGEKILFLDADGATAITDLGRLERELDRISSHHSEPAVVVGSRAHLQEEAVAQRSFFRNFLMHGFHLLVYMLAVRGIRDTQCGFKMMTRSAAAILYQALHINRWAFDVELLYIAQQLGIPIKEVAVNWHEVDGSKMVPIFSWLEMGRDLLFIRARYTFRIWSIKTIRSKEQ